MVATVALSLTLAGVAVKLVYERVFSKEVQQLAVLSTGGQALRAVASGQISYLNLGAKRGEVLYTLQSVSGTTLSINMPCDCKVLPMNAGEGSTVMAGDTLSRSSTRQPPRGPGGRHRRTGQATRRRRHC